MTTTAKANRQPCRVCRGPLTPAARGARYGMPCRPCLLVLLNECQIAANEAAKAKEAVALAEAPHRPVHYYH
mgnify:CR=1 FL=1